MTHLKFSFLRNRSIQKLSKTRNIDLSLEVYSIVNEKSGQERQMSKETKILSGFEFSRAFPRVFTVN